MRERVDDGLDGLRAIESGDEDGVGGQGYRDVGHADEGDERALLTGGPVDRGALGIDADCLAEATRGGRDAGQGSAIAWSMAIFVRCGQFSSRVASNAGVPHVRAIVSRRACRSGMSRARWEARTPADMMNIPAFHR